MKNFTLLATLTIAALVGIESASAQQVVPLHFKNHTQEQATIVYVDGDFSQTYGYLAAGQTHTTNSYLGVSWHLRARGAGAAATITQANQVIEIGNPIPQPNVDPRFRRPARIDSGRTNTQPTVNLPLNAGVLRYSQASQGRRIGRGECTDLAMAALQSAGARLPRQGYDWGQRLSGVNQLQPGDIIQLWNASFNYPDGSWSGTDRHTAIVTRVNGSVIEVLEQNVQGSPVQPGRYDLRYMQGRIEFFRPEAAAGTDGFGDNGFERNPWEGQDGGSDFGGRDLLDLIDVLFN